MMRPTLLLRTAVLPVLAVVLAGCGGGSDPASVSTPDGAAAASRPPGGAGRGGPAATGEIAAVSGRTLQVQNSSSQTAVTYSASTRFTKSAAATLAVGDCVTVTGTPVSATALTATSARVLSTSGDCVAGAGFPGDRDGTPRARPSGAPEGGALPPGAPPSGARPSGALDGRSFAVAFGTVKSVTGSTAVLSGTLRSGGRPDAAGASPSATPTASTITVTLRSSATVTRTVAATSADAKVGVCATATGKADSTGTVAATAIALRPKGEDGCGNPFGRGPDGGTDG